MLNLEIVAISLMVNLKYNSDRSLSIPIIYEDDYLLVVNKPSGLLSLTAVILGIG